MRRRTRLLAALGAAGVVAVCLSVVAVAVFAAQPADHDVTVDEDTLLPDDLMWPWVTHCQGLTGVDTSALTGWFSLDEDGVIDVEYGTLDDDDELIVDERVSAVMRACVQQRSMERPDATLSGLVTPAQRLAIYAWAVDVQQPCLAARGIETRVPPMSDFVDTQTVPWYLLQQYYWANPEQPFAGDFDMLLAARLACPPTPPFLAAQGVG